MSLKGLQCTNDASKDSDSTVIYRAQIYASPSGNIFLPVTGALVRFSLSGAVEEGTVFSAVVTGLCVRIAAGAGLIASARP